MAADTTRPVDEQKYSYPSYIIILSFWKWLISSSKSSGRLSSLPQYFEKNPITYHFQCGQYNLDYHEISKSCSTTKMIKPFNNCNWINPNWECSNRSDSWTYFPESGLMRSVLHRISLRSLSSPRMSGWCQLISPPPGIAMQCSPAS